MTDGNSANPPEGGASLDTWFGMAWVGAEGFAPVLNGLNRTANPEWPDEIGCDEGADGVGAGVAINTYASVYFKEVPAGTFSICQADNSGRNMYGVVIKRPETAAPGLALPTLSAGQITVTWTNGGTLWSAPAVDGPWTSTGDSDGTYTEAATGNKFFQVRR